MFVVYACMFKYLYVPAAGTRPTRRDTRRRPPMYVYYTLNYMYYIHTVCIQLYII